MKKNTHPQRSQFTMIFFAFAFGMIFSNLLNTQSNVPEQEDAQDILFIYRGIEKTQDDMLESERLKISELDRQKIRVIETAALKQYFLDEAHTQQIGVDEAAKQLLTWPPVSEDEVNDFFKQHQDEINKPFYDVKAHIKRSLENSRARVARRNLLNELTQKGDLAILPRHSLNSVEIVSK